MTEKCSYGKERCLDLYELGWPERCAQYANNNKFYQYGFCSLPWYLKPPFGRISFKLLELKFSLIHGRVRIEETEAEC